MGSAAAGPCLDLEPAGGRRLSRQASWTAISAPRPQPLSLRHPHSVAREPLGVGRIEIKNAEHVGEGTDQCFGCLSLLLANERQFLLRTRLNASDALAEHLRQVVASLDLLTSHQ